MMKKRNKTKPISKISSKSNQQVVVSQRQFSGPIPPPDILVAYKAILPDAPQRIIAMAEKQQTHEQQTIDKVVKTQATIEKTGQRLGFTIVISIVGLCFYALYLGHANFAFAALIISAIPLAKVFVFNKAKAKTQ